MHGWSWGLWSPCCCLGVVSLLQVWGCDAAGLVQRSFFAAYSGCGVVVGSVRVVLSRSSAFQACSIAGSAGYMDECMAGDIQVASASHMGGLSSAWVPDGETTVVLCFQNVEKLLYLVSVTDCGNSQSQDCCVPVAHLSAIAHLSDELHC